MTFDYFQEKIQIARKELRKESHQKSPSIYPLQKMGNLLSVLISELASTTKQDLEPLNIEIHSLKSEIELFNIDLSGEIMDDYTKGNQRYSSKWRTQKEKLNSFINRFELLLK